MSRKRNRKVTEDGTGLALAVHELLRRVRFDDVAKVCRWGLTRTECHVLEVVALDGTLSVNEIAARIRLNKSTASRVVQSLSRRKLLRRAVADHDGRSRAVTATKQGLELWREIVEASAAAYTEALAECSPAERNTVMRVLRRIADYATS